ncbi:RusA family crossover junction endodeoxyribonuclease [Lapidilactobacillus gannanensis]|uniref:RusA family crossover junction endodeoxyribonuclease n=1 Tax=Lapidilactobacillus gannanensis TaxID=2486002 RepID=A0ABW4BKK7_9LACO|nr:RusA family crossover junction endodeoxyribonuclease [Lapidilactobacillus gannanensis]
MLGEVNLDMPHSGSSTDRFSAQRIAGGDVLLEVYDSASVHGMAKQSLLIAKNNIPKFIDWLEKDISKPTYNRKVQLTFLGEPVPQGRPRTTIVKGKIIVYDPVDSRKYKQLIKYQAYHQYKDKPLEGQLRCDVKVYRSIQASTNNKQRRLKEQGIVRPIVKGDIDNYFKAVTDPLSKIVWKDDAQIVEGFIGKYYSENPRIEMTISQV